MEQLIETASKMIEPNMTVSFGGGRTVSRLIKTIDTSKISVASPSEQTRNLCQSLNIPIVPLEQVKQFDLAFDGCDSIDHQLNVLKSNGGIHTFERLYANLSKRYIIMAPEARFTEKLNPEVQLTLEVLDLAMPQIISEVETLGGKAEIRQSQNMAGMVRTPNGNGLIDCHFGNWDNIDTIDSKLSQMTGVLGTSYFKNVVTDTLLATNDDVKHIRKEDL
ncbi:ribose 5-phosphate isomerase A [Companilactobacillus musae]|uniref:ribose 5-phosphate isomerase A n=1 Tax=Companilactobacillus musae TaxID=1903258 RepID=UPI000E651579|nr:ribose 5-phosphate isomerase A [Companilactobacillus musae]